MTESSLLQVRGLCLDTPAGRPLLRDLSLALGRTDRVALVGRNGAGKSALLDVLAARAAPDAGTVRCSGRTLLVPQDLQGAGVPASPGELRRLRLEEARSARPDLLLLDEPTRDLDAAGCDWLMGWLSGWRGGLIVVSHRPLVLRAFREFFLVAESGCRHFSGSFDELLADVDRDAGEQEQRYLGELQRLLAAERHRDTVLRRRERKKNLGRIRELRRCTARIRLNGRRSYAQESQGKRATSQQAPIERARTWTRAARRALAVELPLELALPALPPASGAPIALLEGAAARAGARTLFEDLTLSVARERLAIVGPNGSGKSTLLETLAGLRAPASGSVRCDASRIGHVPQDAGSEGSRESVLDHLARGAVTAEAAARILRAHRFPLGLAERPLASLSPGERLRARLICVLQRRPAPELLLLDEPSEPLDFLGTAALQRVLAAWTGGLVVVSHDRDLLRAAGVEAQLELGAARVRRGAVK
jgi:ATPase subunit of ABC transporter with duplicated ATPase domains